MHVLVYTATMKLIVCKEMTIHLFLRFSFCRLKETQNPFSYVDGKHVFVQQTASKVFEILPMVFDID